MNNIFGEPAKGVHSIRFFNIAIIDVLATIISAYIIHYFIPAQYNISLLMVIIILFLAGIIAHRLFNVRTTIDKLLFSG